MKKIGKALILKYVRHNSMVVADIISPILTDSNLEVLFNDEWFKKQEFHKKIGKTVIKKLFHKNKKGSENTVNMKVCIEITDINIEEINKLIAACTSPTVAEITKEIVTVDNISKALEDGWVQKNLVNFIKNMTCKKIRDDNGDVKEKIKVKNLVNIESIRKTSEEVL